MLSKKEIEYLTTRLAEYGYSSLGEYYASPRWLSNKIRFRRAVCSKGCQRCGKLLPVDCHHLTYKTVCDESDKHLAWLCRHCHEYIHTVLQGKSFTLKAQVAMLAAAAFQRKLDSHSGKRQKSQETRHTKAELKKWHRDAKKRAEKRKRETEVLQIVANARR